MSDVDAGIRAALGTRQALLEDAAGRAQAYLAKLAERRVAPGPEAVGALARLDFPLPASGRDPAQVLALLDDVGSPATVATAGPRYFGFVNGGTLPVATAAAWLTAAWDQNAALAVMSPVAARLDDIALRWVAGLLGLPAGLGGAFVTAATMANATCLAAARDAVLARHGWDAGAQGLFGAPPVSVVAGAEAHTTVRKALGLVGLGRDRVITLPADGQGRIVPRDLPALDGPGDRLPAGGQRQQRGQRPVRPAGRLGQGPGRVGSRRRRVRALGGRLSRHCRAGGRRRRGGLVGDRRAQVAEHDVRLRHRPGPRRRGAARRHGGPGRLPARRRPAREPMHYTPQSSQRARGVEVWAVLATLGRDGVAGLVERTCRLARRFAGGLREAGVDRPERRRAQPGRGRLRQPGPDRRGDRRDPARRNLLVRPDRLAGTARHAAQRELLEHHRGRHRPEHRRHAVLPVRGPAALTSR